MKTRNVCANCKKINQLVSIWIAEKDGKDIGMICTDCANKFRSMFESDVKTMRIYIDTPITLNTKRSRRMQ